LLAGAARRFRCQIDNQPLFPDVCAKNGKWFRRAGELFRHGSRTKQPPEKLNDFTRIRLMEQRFQGPSATADLHPDLKICTANSVVRCTSGDRSLAYRIMISGAGVGIGDPQR
jgi:hypothetical protein